MAKYTVRLVYPSGTTKDVFHTDSKAEADEYIKAPKELRPRVRHQLGTKRSNPQEYAFICTRSMGCTA